jgi:uncharacterized membrane protein YczE
MKLREFLVKTFMLLLGLFIMAFGISLSVKSNLGTMCISSIPYVLSLILPTITVGQFTILFNILLVLLQIIILRKNFKFKQFLQIFLVIPFGYFIDLTLSWIININLNNYFVEWVFCLLGIFVLSLGILIEIKSNVLYMPGEGIVLAISEVVNIDFGKLKPICDMTMVLIAVFLSFIFLGELFGVREGTIAAAILVGILIDIYDFKFGNKIDNLRDFLLG